MSQVVGRYELLRPLGRGGMAEVFHARRRGPGGVEKRLVVKRIRRERSADPRFVQLFVQEARLSMSLAHKNIVPVFDFGRVGDELFLVMEYVDGPDLAAAIDRSKSAGQPIDPELAAFVALEACQALDYAHRARDEAGAPRTIVHRDVTTRNVLVSSSGEVKLVDFGVATSETDLGARKVRGTPAYMSPEQARGDAVDARSDVFSLGLVLYELLAGDRAYRAARNPELLEQARLAAIPTLPDPVPDELKSIVARATAAEPGDRFADARAMQLALDSFLVKARAQSGGPPPSVRLAGWIEAIWSGHDRGRPAGDSADAGTRAPTGPVVTFLDDGEQALTSMAAGDETLQSMAATLGESVAGTANGTANDEAALDNRSAGGAGTEAPASASSGHKDTAAGSSNARQSKTARRAAWFPWSVAAAVAVLAAIGVTAVVDSGASAPDIVRPATAPDSTSAAKATPGVGNAAGEAGHAGGVNAGDGNAASEPGNAGDLNAGDVAGATGSGIAPADDDARLDNVDDRAATGATAPARASRARAVNEPARSLDQTPTSAPPGAPPRDTGADVSTGTAAIAVRPWAQVSVAGRDESCPETPCRIELPAGRHTLRLEHTVWNVGKTVDVEIRAGEVTQVSEVLLQPR